MAGPEPDYPDEIVTDREIEPLSSGSSRLPTTLFAVAAGGGILLLLLLQLLSGDNGSREAQQETFAPAIQDAPRAQIIVPPAQVIEPEEDFTDEEDRQFALFEAERARQLALLEEQRLRAQQARNEAQAAEDRRRRSSTMLVIDNGGSAPTTGFNNDDLSADALGAGLGDEGFGGLQQDANLRNEVITNSSERFLRDASNIGVAEAQAVKFENQNFLITQGTIISGVLETMINSDLPGLVRALVDKPVYSRTGSQILIPRGSRLIGRYQSGIDVGQSRVYIVWTRMERPDGAIIELGSPGIDPIGQAGLGGDVDNHFFQRFGASVLFSSIGPAISALADGANTGEQGEQIISGAREGFNRSAEVALQYSIDIPPTIRVAQGSEISIFVNRDLSFAGLNN